jgi:ABC-type antimicrobial peptide transport system permease subunit
MLPVFLGAAAGICITLVGGRVMASLLYGVATTDAAAIGGAVVIFILVALAAILVATRGAARTDPMVILRTD